jgi:hypothetical protein
MRLLRRHPDIAAEIMEAKEGTDPDNRPDHRQGCPVAGRSSQQFQACGST